MMLGKFLFMVCNSVLYFLKTLDFTPSRAVTEWFNILLKVRPPQLTGYLQQKKAEGYTVIGVEQTARSADLTHYCFPERALLLLG